MSSWLLAISIILSLLAHNIIFKYFSFSKKENLLLGGTFLSIINICFPYLSVELLLQFIYTSIEIASSESYGTIFQYNNSYALMVLVETYLIFFSGPALVVNSNISIQNKFEAQPYYTTQH